MYKQIYVPLSCPECNSDMATLIVRKDGDWYYVFGCVRCKKKWKMD